MTEEFRDRRPISGQKGYPRVTQAHSRAEHEISLRYADLQGITEWP